MLQKAEPLPEIIVPFDMGKLLKYSIDVTVQYNELAERHDALVDLEKQRGQ